MKEMIFTQRELEKLGHQTLDLLIEAIDRQDTEEAKRLSRRMYREFESMHDNYCYWIASLLSFVLRRFGVEAVFEALRESCSEMFEPLAKVYEGQSPKRWAELFAAGLRGHLQPLKIEEDEEKFTFIMKPCGSGGRLILQGHYEPNGRLSTIKEPHPIMTYSRKDFPIYCAHCPFQEIVFIEQLGFPLFITLPSDKIGEEPCRMIIYKDPSRIPDFYYERIGKKKP